MKRILVIIGGSKKQQDALDFLKAALDVALIKTNSFSKLMAYLDANPERIGDIASFVAIGIANPEAREASLRMFDRINAHDDLAALPVVYLGQDDDHDFMDACEDAGVLHLAMPVDDATLLDELRGLIYRELHRPGDDGGSDPGFDADEGSDPPFYEHKNVYDIESGGSIGGSDPIIHPELESQPAFARGSDPEYTDAGTISHVEGSPSDLQSERRTATVMFADISGFTAMSESMDPEQVRELMNRCFEMLGECIDAHGGTIDKFIGDCVMAVFGVPRAIEDAPLMAVNCAIDMRNRLYRFNRENSLAVPLDIHVGVNTGPVVAGGVGSLGRKDFTVMGDTVNLAARLEDASPLGFIFVGPETNKATKDDFKYRALKPIALKGKAEPVPVFELQSTREKRRKRQRVEPTAVTAGPERMIYSTLVGREKEMNQLRLQVMKLVNGEGGIVSVVGEAGIGKSRLLAELKSDDALQQVTLLEGRAISMGRNLSFHPIIDLLKNWAGIPDDDAEGESFARLEKAVRGVHPDEADEILPFVATLMGMKLAGRFAERVKGIEGEALEKLILKNVRALIIKGAELRPMIICVEDLHWADTSSIELMESLFRLVDRHRILFINVFRPNYKETGDRVIAFITDELNALRAHSSEIIIQPLDDDDSALLIANLLNIRGLPRALEEQIRERSGGNPFFIEEVIRSLIDEGAVALADGEFAITDKIHDVVVPRTVGEVLMSRIDRLDEETRALVKTASVIGRYFFHKIIAQVAANISDIDRRLSHLEDVQLIRERKRMDELEYLFKHALAQETAYESLLIAKRKELHIHVAQAIENVFGERLHEFYGMLAYHYGKADDSEKAEEYLLKAGEEAMKASASSEALEYFIKSLKLYQDLYGDRVDPKKIARLEKNIAIAHYNRGDYVEAVDYFTRVLEYHGETFPKGEFSSLYKAFRGFCHLMIGLYLPLLKWRKAPTETDVEIVSLYEKRAISLAHPDPRRFFIESFYVFKRLVRVNVFSNEYLLSFFTSISAVFSWPSLSRAISNKILLYSSHGTASDKAHQHFLQVWNHHVQEFMVSDWSMEPYDDVMTNSFIAKGDIYRTQADVIFLGFWYLEIGDLISTSLMVKKLYEIGITYDHIQSKSFKSILNMRFLMKTRRFHDAMKEFKESIGYYDKIGEKILHFEAHTFKARILLLSGDIIGAGECLEYLEKLYNEMDLIPFYKSDYRIARFMYDTRLLEEASISAKKAGLAVLRRKAIASGKVALRISKKFKRDRTEALKLMGTCCWLTGETKKALAWWDQSIKTGELLGAKLELSRTYFEVGKRLREVRRFNYGKESAPATAVHPAAAVSKLNGLSAEEYLDKARVMFTEMGLAWDLEQVGRIFPAKG